MAREKQFVNALSEAVLKQRQHERKAMFVATTTVIQLP